MVYGDLQFFDIIIFAAIAVFIIYRLRSVLGKRTGFQKNTNQEEKQFIKKETKPQQGKIPQLNESEKKQDALKASKRRVFARDAPRTEPRWR